MHTPSRPLITLFSLLGSACLLAQGPLTPGSSLDPTVGLPNPLDGGNNPQETMKTLHQVEPRKTIESVATPADPNFDYIITASGSYYLTTNLFTFKSTSIRIAAEGVTLDLNGFQILRFAPAGSGIEISEDADRCTVKNGSITGFNFGINRILNVMDEAVGGSYQNLAVTDHSNIGLLGGKGWTVEHCRVHGGSNTGISVGAGSTVTNCTVSNMNASAGTYGIQVGNGSSITNCSLSDCDVVWGFNTGEGCTLDNATADDLDCTAGVGFSYGIFADNGSTISNCSVTNSDVVYGIGSSVGCTLVNCTAAQNASTEGTGFSYGIIAGTRSLMRGCTSVGNTNSATGNNLLGAGISAQFHCQVVDCMSNLNGGAGIVLNQGTVVRDCKLHSNGQGGVGAGIFALDGGSPGWNKLVGNDCEFNEIGIDIDTTANLVIKNTCRGNTENFNIVTNNRVGSIAIPANSGAITGTGAGMAGGVGTTDPWGNLSY